MESKKKIRKAAVPSSSSDDSSSDSSTDARRKQKHRRKQDSSSSSEEEVVHKHKHQHKKSSSSRKHSHSSRSRMLAANAKEKLRGVSPRSAHKHHAKVKLVKKSKLIEEHERRRDVIKERTPEHRITSPTTRIRVSIPNNRVQDVRRSIKDSPSTSRRHVLRETPSDEHISRQKQMRRIQEEEHYKYGMPKGERSSRITPEKHHHQHERSRSHSHGRVPIRERLDKADYEYPREVSREREYSPMLRAPVVGPRGEPIDRPYESYRGEDRRHLPAIYSKLDEYGSGPSSRHHRPNWEEVREPEHPRSRGYEGGAGSREWEHPHERKRPPLDEPHFKERPWNDHRGEKEPKEWSRGSESSSWKDRGPPNQMAPTMPHPRRWPGPTSDTWAPRGSHPPNKHDSHSSSSGGPPFKPRGSPYFGFGRSRFPFKRFPNQYTKINYPSKRVIPSASETSAIEGNKSDQSMSAADNIVKPSTPSSNEQESNKPDALESGEIASEMEEEKVAQQPDTTFSGITDATEECEGNLSEFSDVDDEILNREEIESAHHSDDDDEPFPSRSHKTLSAGRSRLAYARNAAEKQQQQSNNLSAEQREDEQDESAQKMISKIHANKELKKEMDLDFEEISDGELEEESKSKIKGLGDALGVDWASLAKETQKPSTRSTSEIYNMTRSRWSAHRILWDIGVSVKYAGEEFARNTLTEARNELRREKQDWLLKQKEQLNGDIKKEESMDIEIKQEPEDNPQTEQTTNEITEENCELEDFELDMDILPHPLAQMQVLMRKLAIERQNLILNPSSKNGRALSSRKDLSVRRQLCNLPTKDSHLDRSAVTNAELNNTVDAIYRQLVGAEAN